MLHFSRSGIERADSEVWLVSDSLPTAQPNDPTIPMDIDLDVIPVEVAKQLALPPSQPRNEILPSQPRGDEEDEIPELPKQETPVTHPNVMGY